MLPSTATRAPRATSSAEKNRPWLIERPRIESQSGVVPASVESWVRSPAEATMKLSLVGATPVTSGALAGSAKASTSARLSVAYENPS